MLMCVYTASDREAGGGVGVKGIESERDRVSLRPLSGGDYVSLLSCVLTFRMLLNFNGLSSGFTDYSYGG